MWLGAPQTPLNLDGSEHGGLQPPRQDAVVWRRLPAFTAVRIPRRMARHFEWTTRRSRVGTDRFGTGRVVLAAEYQPGYDGLPGGAQGLRAPGGNASRAGLFRPVACPLPRGGRGACSHSFSYTYSYTPIRDSRQDSSERVGVRVRQTQGLPHRYAHTRASRGIDKDHDKDYDKASPYSHPNPSP